MLEREEDIMYLNYPEDFKARCKIAYPDFQRLHELLDAGSELVGRILDESATGSLPVDTVLRATSLTELQALAALEKERRVLYNEWSRIRYWVQYGGR